MRTLTKNLAVVSAIAMLGVSGAQASIIAGNAAGGSEAILSVVNATGDSISQDLGRQISGLTGTSYNLGSSVLSFISAAGGLSNVTYGIIAGNTVTRQYLTTSAAADFADNVQVAESAKSLWAGSLNLLVQNLNQGDATPTSANLAYGPFLAGSGSPNYLDGLHDNWTSGDFQFSNLAPGTDLLYLYSVQFTASNLGLRSFTPVVDGIASLNLTSGQLVIGTVVPLPAAVWLFGSAIGLVGALRRRGARAA
jgi:hypothetical protein